MKQSLAILGLLISIFCQAQSNLLPQPNQLKLKGGNFQVSSSTIVVCKKSSPELDAYINRFIQRLQNRSNLYFNTPFVQDTLAKSSIEIQVNKNIDSLFVKLDESYSIDITNNKALLKANNNIGAYRGLETLLQLINPKGKNVFIPNLSIVDQPRFPWRGLMIDVCRHWIPIEVIKRNIDAMAAVKMNVLHLHLTEDQAFRIECKTYPKLHELGSNGNYFTQEEIKSIVNYAFERGIRVVPEFDIPGHATSWAIGYPELMSEEKDYKLETNYGVFDPTFNPTKEETYFFFSQFIKEMSALFPDAYFHIGGDENNGNQWKENDKIQDFMEDHNLKDNHALQAYFNQRIQAILLENHKRMVGWDEIYQPNTSKDIVIQSWRGKESLYKTAKDGYPGILSNGYYLDMAFSAKKYYENDPIPFGSEIADSTKAQILGGEATMWSELVSKQTVDSRIWPVTAAIAERLWSNTDNCNTDKLYQKLPVISSQLEEHGLHHINYQGMLLRQMSGLPQIENIQDYVQLFEPLKGYKRHKFIKYKTHYPLSRFVDACYTESYSSLHLLKLAETNCVRPGVCRNREKIKLFLRKSIKSNEEFLKVADQSRAFMEIKPLAYKTLELMELAWEKINSPKEFNDDKMVRAIQLLEEVKEYKLDCKFSAIKGLEIIFK